MVGVGSHYTELRPPPLPSLKFGEIPNWVLKTEQSVIGDSLSYLDMMERNTLEETRRARERQIMEEGIALHQQKKKDEEDIRYRETEEAREYSKMRMFGRPGHGAPTVDNRKKRFTEHQFDSLRQGGSDQAGGSYQPDDFRPPPPPARRFQEDLLDNDALAFGRPGCGAPQRTKSGRIRTAIFGNPEIRFQGNESVRKTINNNIRYATDREEKAVYGQQLEDQIRERRQTEEAEKVQSREIARQLEETEGLQWGRPGPGGTYWRNSALTGQNFFDRMGWCGSADPRKRGQDTKHSEADEIKREIEEFKVKKEVEHADMTSGEGIELVPLMKAQNTGKPHKDPSTGYMMSHGLSSTDVTKLADKQGGGILSTRHPQDDRKRYSDTLNSQIHEKCDFNLRTRQFEEEQQKRHFESWETFWGRPGYGAPKPNTTKGNLMKMLHYPDKAPNNVELITLERLPCK